ncbi:hypothetical protein BN128_1099 [Cronobacter sakazakii 696]|nr:hypothetical protein BN128_1099 [Cronobacter sakazakii 696]
MDDFMLHLKRLGGSLFDQTNTILKLNFFHNNVTPAEMNFYAEFDQLVCN